MLCSIASSKPEAIRPAAIAITLIPAKAVKDVIIRPNVALAGDATLTETGFSGSDSDYGPVNPAVTTYFNGTQTTSLVEYLVNGDNKTPGAGGTLNRYLFVGVLASSIDLSQVKEGTVWISVETSDTSEMSESCTVYEWNNTKFTLSVE